MPLGTSHERCFRKLLTAKVTSQGKVFALLTKKALFKGKSEGYFIVSSDHKSSFFKPEYLHFFLHFTSFHYCQCWVFSPQNQLILFSWNQFLLPITYKSKPPLILGEIKGINNFCSHPAYCSLFLSRKCRVLMSLRHCYRQCHAVSLVHFKQKVLEKYHHKLCPSTILRKKRVYLKQIIFLLLNLIP